MSRDMEGLEREVTDQRGSARATKIPRGKPPTPRRLADADQRADERRRPLIAHSTCESSSGYGRG
jgi:hypothetical protein